MSENEARLPGPSTVRQLLDSMREPASSAAPRVPIKITVAGPADEVERAFPRICELFYPQEGLALGGATFRTVGWEKKKAPVDGAPWTLTVELIEALI